ncbi:hypothetical protein Plec18170_009492 [Paecilomyces lecythidis]
MTLSIEEISDRLEINDLYTSYAHAADDRETLDGIFLPHTTFDWSSGGGGKMTYEEAKRGPIFTGKLFPWSFHICVNVRIKFSEDRRSAEVKVKTISPMGLENQHEKKIMFQLQGSYVDGLIKTDDGWRIASRIWHESSAIGPFDKVDGISGMIELAGIKI